MPHIPLPSDLSGVRALLAFRPEIAGPLAALTDALLHAPNTLTAGERELIAAYVSSLNNCEFCCASHSAIAACHMNDDRTFVDAAIKDPEGSTLSRKTKALLAIAAQVQRGGHFVTPFDIARARNEGATDVQIHDAVLIAAVFCMFNRYVDGLDASAPIDPATYQERARQVAIGGYAASIPQPPK